MPNIIRFLGVGKPEPLPEDETAYIDWLANDNKPLGISDICLAEGNKVTVLHGPLVGYEGIIIKINKHQRRARVSIIICGRKQDFSLSINVLGAE